MADEAVGTDGISDAGVTLDPTVSTDVAQTQQGAPIVPQTQVAQTEQAATEEIPAEQLDATGKPLSSYQRLVTRYQALETEHKTAAEKLAELEGDGPFVGIKVDKHAAEWQPLEQLQALPDAHRSKLVGAVMESYLPSAVSDLVKAEIAANPTLAFESRSPEFQKYAQAVVPIVQIAYGRTIQDMDAIMEMVGEYTPQQLQQRLQGQAQEQQFGQSQYGQQVSPTGQQAAALFAAAEQSGLDPNDPGTQQFISNMSGVLSKASSEMIALRTQMQTIQSQLKQQGEKVEKSEVETRVQSVDQQVKALQSETLKSVTAGRVPEGDRMTGMAIESLAGQLLGKDIKAQGYLAAAKNWAQDGLEAKAKAQLGLYAAAVARAYKEAADYQLGKVVKTAEQQAAEDAARAGQTRLGAGAAAVGSNGSAQQFLANKQVNSMNAAEIAIALYDQQNQRAS